MEKVLGIGGLFFRSQDPKALALWYQQHLGINIVPTSYDAESWQQEAGSTVFAPFDQNTDYFGDSQQQWMINFRVRDLAAFITQLEHQGIAVKLDPVVYPNGHFARLHDPEGNPIELWQPA
jgi:predicted enzyme related to lactoylglutathione lyase